LTNCFDLALGVLQITAIFSNNKCLRENLKLSIRWEHSGILEVLHYGSAGYFSNKKCWSRQWERIKIKLKFSKQDSDEIGFLIIEY